MKKILFIIALSVSSLCVFGQTFQWNTLPDMPIDSRNAPATANDTALFYIANAMNNNEMVSTIYYFSFANNVWEELTTTPEMAWMCAMEIVDTCLFIMGGDLWSSQTYEYNLVSNVWTRKADMPTPLQHVAWSSVVVDSLIYVFGGLEQGSVPNGSYDWEGNAVVSDMNQCYNYKTDTWTQLTPMPTARHNVAAVAIDSLIYLIGGNGDESSIWSDLDNVEVYNTQTDSWTETTPLPVAMSGSGAEVINNNIVVLCGWEGENISNSIYTYNPIAEEWSTAQTTTPKEISAAGITSRDSKIYVINGCNSSYSSYNSVYEIVLTSLSGTYDSNFAETLYTAYPNPTDGVIYFHDFANASCQVQVINNMGLIVINTITTKGFVDMAGLSSGVYQLKLTVENKNYLMKIIIK